MGGGWQTARGAPTLDDATRATMRGRSDWNELLDAPLPAATEDASGSTPETQTP
jgi:hypothetical protein